MSTSSGNFPRHLTKIDELTRRDHFHLQAADVCYFLGEYTSHEGYQYSETNQLIFNFKKDVSRRGRREWTYKEKAIRKVAAAFREAIPRPPSGSIDTRANTSIDGEKRSTIR